MANHATPGAAQHLADVVRMVIGEIRPKLIDAALSGDRSENENTRHSDNFLSAHDLWMHQRYRELLAQRFNSFIYASEEDDPFVVGKDPDPDLCILVDPLDTSELAVRALNGYTHVMVYSRALGRPIAAAVGDIFHHLQLYIAVRDHSGDDRAFVFTADGNRHVLDLETRESTSLSDSLITNFFMKPAERFAPLSRQARLLHVLGEGRGRIGLDFGSIGLCHIAAGFTDAMVEFAKGFAIWDLAPGQYILSAAGGVVYDLNGVRITLDNQLGTIADITAAMRRRQKFIAAKDEALARSILSLITI
ncbi:inositol monophosphatase family protein [Acrocarpospora catenulata]|uniref:inositol monophosphatase family protein n=1 Tax=Acrocarpospora catenulata TaxID=2836182 RepID=UPI001BDB3C9A|nr:inositol monophosphatase family protein [Acrocarpospora catenulata]